MPRKKRKLLGELLCHHMVQKTGFINQKILDFVFNSSNNYIQKFKSIKFKNICIIKEKIDLKDIIEDFLREEGIKIQQLIRNKEKTIKFVSYLNLYRGTFSKNELSDALKIGRTTLYRWLKE